MRILHINKYLYRRGGAEGYMLDLAELQRRRGHEVELWGMHHPENPPALPLSHLFASHVELDPAPRGLAGVRSGARMIWSPAAARGLTRALAAFRPDVVHCHNIYHQLSPSVLGAVRRAGVRCVMTLHDYKLACPSYQLLDKGALCDACVTGGPLQAVRRRCKSGSLSASALLSAESWLHRQLRAYDPVDVLISPSRFLAGVMAEAGVGGDRVKVVNHFVHLEDGVNGVDGRARSDRFVFAGRLSHEKGVDTLVEAVGLMGDARLDVAGDGPQRDHLERLAADLAPGRVSFHGRLSKPDLQRLMGNAVATVVPSRWHENQPMTILESYALGVPIVATSLGGMPELVRDGVDGHIVAADDPAALAGAMTSVAGDLDRAAAMGRAGREKLAADFTPDAHLDRIERLYLGQEDHG